MGDAADSVVAMKTYGKISYFPSISYVGGVRTTTEGHGWWEIDARPDVMIRLRRLFPRVQSTHKGTIRISDSTDVARDIEWAMQRYPLEWSNITDFGYFVHRVEQFKGTERAITEILNGKRREGVMLEPARPPRDYQLVAADLALATGSLLIVHGVGLGKSFTSLLTLREDDALPALVVTLGGVLPKQWVNQLKLAFPEMHGHILGIGKHYDPAERDGVEPDVVVLPYSRLAKWQDYLKGRVQTVIFDEIQELRHTGTDKYAAAMTVAAGASFKLGLTATPIYGYGDQTHTICEVLRPGALGDRQEFLREWGGHIVGTAGNYEIEEMTGLGHYMVEIGLMDRKSRKDVGRIMVEPERIIQEIITDTSEIEDAARDVSEIAKRFLHEEGAKGLERMQWARDIDLKMRHATGVAKAPHVADFARLLLEAEEKLIIFGWHHDVYDIWKDRLADFAPVLYTGKETTAGKVKSIESFLTGTSRVMLMSLRAGAGIDGLQDVCSVVLFGELDWSPAVHTQNIGRVARDYTDGKTKDELCVAYFCTTEDGSDPLMEDVLAVKAMQSDALTDPDAELITAVNNSDRIERLARSVLDRTPKSMF